MKMVAIALATILAAALMLGVMTVSFEFLHLNRQYQQYIFIAAAVVAAILWVRGLIHWRRILSARNKTQS